MTDPILPDDAEAFEFISECVSESDPVVVEGIRRGLADAEAGRVQSLDQFNREFRARHGITMDG